MFLNNYSLSWFLLMFEDDEEQIDETKKKLLADSCRGDYPRSNNQILSCA